MYVCLNRAHRPHWRVVQRLCNHSAFNGGRRTSSQYSSVRCLVCGRQWRTKARYVAGLLDAMGDEAYQNPYGD